MIPDPNVTELKMDHINSPNSLLAAIFMYRILEMFTEGTITESTPGEVPSKS